MELNNSFQCIYIGEKMYYTKTRGGKRIVRKAVAHIWTGVDTMCTMYSTGGLLTHSFDLVEELGNKKICKLCLDAVDKLSK